MKPAIIEKSIFLWLRGECRWIDMVWFWLWLWLGVERDPGDDPFDWADPLYYEEGAYNLAVAMDCGPSDAFDWDQWVARFPSVGYAVRSVSNY